MLEGLKNIFEHTGCIPRSILFDNDSTIVKKVVGHGVRKLTEGFRRFQLHYGFESKFCNVASGNEKGSVENKVGYHRRNFLVPPPEFKEIKEYNRQLLEKCDRDMDRMHYREGRKIKELFEEDKKEMLPLPAIAYEVYKYCRVRADKYGKVKFEGKYYSTSPAYAGKEVIIKAGAYEVIILDTDYRHVQHHERLYGQKKESMKWGPYLELMSKRPEALKYTAFFKELPPILKEYFEECEYQEKKVALRMLKKMVHESGLEIAKEAFKGAIECGARDIDSIWSLYWTMTRKPPEVQETELSEHIPLLEPYTPDNTQYDRLLLKGGVT